MKRFLLGLLFLFTTSALAQPPLYIEPRDCKFFDGTITAGSDRNSTTTFGKPFDLRYMGRLSVQVTWASLTGSVDATVKVQVSDAPTPVTADWIDKPGATFTMSGASGTNLINITIIGERWGRVVYTHNSVSGGTLTGYCHAKSI